MAYVVQRIPVSAGGAEQVRVRVRDLDGQDISGVTGAVALLPPDVDTPPSGTAWSPGDVQGDGDRVVVSAAAPGDTPPATYRPWVKVTDGAEVIIRPAAGRVIVS